MVISLITDTYEQPDICAPCGGACCKRYAGASFPTEWGANADEIREKIREAILTGKWVVDAWDGDPRGIEHGDARYVSIAYYIRPAHKDRTGWLVDLSYGGECVFLSESGCALGEKRPTGCKGLEPKRNDGCVVQYGSKQDAAIAWLPYHDMILELLNELRDY